MDKPLFFKVPIVLTIAAESYEAAVKEAENVAGFLSLDAGMGIAVVSQFEHDNEGQRVLYLHPEDEPEEF